MPATIDRRQFDSADGLKLFYQAIEPSRLASSIPILCIPGLTRNHRDFSTIAASLGQNHRVICPDLRGRGNSEYDSNPEHYQIEFYVQDIMQLLSHEGIDEYAIVGTSLGGILAMVLAGISEPKLKAVVLNDIGGFVPKVAVQGIHDYISAAGPFDSWEIAAKFIQQNNEATFTNLNQDDWLRVAKNVYRETENNQIAPNYDPNIIQSMVIDDLDLWEQYDNLLPIPTLLVRGKNSELLSERTATIMAGLKEDLLRVDVPHRGHAPFLDEAEALEAIVGFFSQNL